MGCSLPTNVTAKIQIYIYKKGKKKKKKPIKMRVG